jgi:methyltransferase-like protein/trans-aconitate methyltransferase
MLPNFIYDDVPYPSYSFPQTHPNQLAISAKLLGLTPPALENCRVLELGCANGSNLNWIAHTLPDGRFTGIDLSGKQIEMAKAAVGEIGLRNVEFYAEDVMDMPTDSLGKFDYIIAHGLFSWVPEVVRERVLQIYHELLAPDGVGYISYNVYPGSHLQDITRNLMRFHADQISDPFEKVNKWRRFIKVLGDSMEPENVYRKIIEHELAQLDNKKPMTIFHDDIAEFNQPFYFSDFIVRAGKYGLQFLSEIDNFSPQTDHLPEEFQEILQNLGGDVIKIEQYLDFQKMRRFRQTLLVHSGAVIDREVKPAKIKEFLIGSPVRYASQAPDLRSKANERFAEAGNRSFEISHPLTKAILYYLSTVWPQSVNFSELIEHCSELLNDDKDALSQENIETATGLLLELFKHNFVKLYLYQPKFITQITDKPKISEFARFQARTRNVVTSLTGSALRVENDFVRSVIFLLDGTRRKLQILTELGKNPKMREIKNLPMHLDNLLLVLSKSGLLVN